MDEPITPDQLAALPLFPLPGLVFFPGTLLPLHIFEQRYREMTAWCLARRSPLGVVRIAPGYEADQPRDPPVEQILGVGRITRHQRLADGRYNVVLEGIGRVRLLEELDRVTPYRVARCALVPDAADEPAAVLAQQVQALRLIAGILIQRDPAAGSVLSPLLGRALGPGALADALAAVIFAEPDERQRLLETPRVGARLQAVTDRLAELAATPDGPEA